MELRSVRMGILLLFFSTLLGCTIEPFRGIPDPYSSSDGALGLEGGPPPGPDAVAPPPQDARVPSPDGMLPNRETGVPLVPARLLVVGDPNRSATRGMMGTGSGPPPIPSPFTPDLVVQLATSDGRPVALSGVTVTFTGQMPALGGPLGAPMSMMPNPPGSPYTASSDANGQVTIRAYPGVDSGSWTVTATAMVNGTQLSQAVFSLTNL